MHQIILNQLGIHFFEQFTRTTGGSAERLYQLTKMHTHFIDALNILCGAMLVLAIYVNMYSFALFALVLISTVNLPIYWELTGIGSENAKCALQWGKIRKKVLDMKSFNNLLRELSISKSRPEEVFTNSFHFGNCLAEVMKYHKPLPIKLPVAAFETP